MAEIILIHGYGFGSELDDPVLKQYLFLGFEAFQPLVDKKRALLFDWSIKRSVSVRDVSNPVFQYKVYREDLKRAYSEDTQQALTNTLRQEKPTVVVCHSMGAKVLMEQIRKSQLPASVAHVVFIQGDLSRSFSPEEGDFFQRVKERRISWHNYYCPWDNALIASMVLNRYIPKGLTGSNNPYIKNVFFPLRKGPNFHTSSISDSRLLEHIEPLFE